MINLSYYLLVGYGLLLHNCLSLIVPEASLRCFQFHGAPDTTPYVFD